MVKRETVGARLPPTLTGVSRLENKFHNMPTVVVPRRCRPRLLAHLQRDWHRRGLLRYLPEGTA